jgi:hypothetical protein
MALVLVVCRQDCGKAILSNKTNNNNRQKSLSLKTIKRRSATTPKLRKIGTQSRTPQDDAKHTENTKHNNHRRQETFPSQYASGWFPLPIHRHRSESSCIVQRTTTTTTTTQKQHKTHTNLLFSKKEAKKYPNKCQKQQA